MAQPMRKAEGFPHNAEETRDVAKERGGAIPGEDQSRGIERESAEPTLAEQIRARADQPHKGDVGRPGTNEEIFQGSKAKELK